MKTFFPITTALLLAGISNISNAETVTEYLQSREGVKYLSNEIEPFSGIYVSYHKSGLKM